MQGVKSVFELLPQNITEKVFHKSQAAINTKWVAKFRRGLLKQTDKKNNQTTTKNTFKDGVKTEV